MTARSAGLAREVVARPGLVRSRRRSFRPAASRFPLKCVR